MTKTIRNALQEFKLGLKEKQKKTPYIVGNLDSFLFIYYFKADK